MRIKKSLMQCKVLILLFGLSLHVFVPAFGKLRSGGQLSLSVDTPQSSVEPDVQEKSQLQPATAPQTILAEDSYSTDKLVQTHVDVQKPVEKKQPASKSNISAKEDREKKIIFNFEDVDLASVAANVEKIFDVTFITDESIKPPPKGGKVLSGHKVSFKTQRPLTKQQAWNIFETFLDMVGLYLVQQADPKFYRIKIADKAKRSALQSFINVDPEKLPNSDTLIRYGYFVKDCPLDTINKVLQTLKSNIGDVLILNDHNAFIITDSAYNIKVLMQVVKELDKVTMPQTMSVLHLYKVEAKEVKELYEKLTKDEQEGTVAARLFGPKKPSRALYFPKNAKIIAEERTNSLILLGTEDAIRKIEEFVTKYVDVDSKAPYAPFFVYNLKYADAQNVANIMTNLVKFGQEGDRKLVGAMRGGDKYFKQMSFTAEPANNRLIIRGNFDDFQKIKKILDDIDEPPVQVAVEILIVAVRIEDRRDLGIQLRNKFQSPDGTRASFQTSGITMGGAPSTVIPNPDPNVSGSLRLLGDLIKLVTAAAPGTTAISLGSDKLGVWGIFGVLNTIANTQIVANPFLTATNNSKARVKLGETKRVVSSIVQTGGVNPTESFQDLAADIEVTVQPTINSDGMIVMGLQVSYNNFVLGTNTRQMRTINTTVVSASGETLALGGLLRDRQEDSLSKVPVLGNVPILGWFFKNKLKRKEKEDLLVLVNAHIVEPGEDVKRVTKRRIKEYKDDLQMINEDVNQRRDPVDRAFFKDVETKYKLEDYIFTRGKNEVQVVKSDTEEVITPRERRRRRREARKQAKTPRKASASANTSTPRLRRTGASADKQDRKKIKEKKRAPEGAKQENKQIEPENKKKSRTSKRRERRRKRRRKCKKVENPTLVV